MIIYKVEISETRPQNVPQRRHEQKYRRLSIIVVDGESRAYCKSRPIPIIADYYINNFLMI